MGGDKIEKITIMVLKVDLQCSSRYKKVKKVLGKFPQIRDQVYDEKANSITIKVFCCNPEKIRDKLCYEGGGIEIIEPSKPDKTTKPNNSQPQIPSVYVMQIQGYPHQPPPGTYCCDQGSTEGPYYHHDSYRRLRIWARACTKWLLREQMHLVAQLCESNGPYYLFNWASPKIQFGSICLNVIIIGE